MLEAPPGSESSPELSGAIAVQALHGRRVLPHIHGDDGRVRCSTCGVTVHNSGDLWKRLSSLVKWSKCFITKEEFSERALCNSSTKGSALKHWFGSCDTHTGTHAANNYRAPALGRPGMGICAAGPAGVASCGRANAAAGEGKAGLSPELPPRAGPASPRTALTIGSLSEEPVRRGWVGGVGGQRVSDRLGMQWAPRQLPRLAPVQAGAEPGWGGE